MQIVFHTKPAQIYRDLLEKNVIRQLFEDYIADGATTGRDGVTVKAFSENLDTEISLIIRKIQNETYKFTPYKEKLISKGAQKNPRQISIPTVRDKLVLKFLTNFLKAVYSVT